jgi:tripartite-type tricarboxylate transporter receptor subunit TctC
VACFTLALSPAALAQDYPSRTIKMIVPTGAGGITDILARLVGKSITDQLGQPVVIENRPGAGGTIGTRAAAVADPDGYTLLMVFPSHAANPALYASLPYDSEKDFAPVSMVTKVSEILLVPNSSPAKSVKDLIELARKQQLNYASVGVGSLAHLATELFLSTAGVKMTHIPYRGVPQAQQAVMTGEVAAFFDTPITALPQIHAGSVRALGITSSNGSRLRLTFRASRKPACRITR